MEEGDQRFTFVFLGVKYTVPLFGSERCNVSGPWPKGQWVFGRRKKETADAFVRRVRLDAKKAEVRSRPRATPSVRASALCLQPARRECCGLTALHALRCTPPRARAGGCLCKPPGGVKTRWGFYGKSALWCLTSHLVSCTQNFT